MKMPEKANKYRCFTSANVHHSRQLNTNLMNIVLYCHNISVYMHSVHYLSQRGMKIILGLTYQARNFTIISLNFESCSSTSAGPINLIEKCCGHQWLIQTSFRFSYGLLIKLLHPYNKACLTSPSLCCWTSREKRDNLLSDVMFPFQLSFQLQPEQTSNQENWKHLCRWAEPLIDCLSVCARYHPFTEPVKYTWHHCKLSCCGVLEERDGTEHHLDSM